MSTPSLFIIFTGDIRIVGLEHDSVIPLQFPAAIAVATTASPAAVVLAVEQAFVVTVFAQGAVNKMLLGIVHRRFVLLLRNVPLERRICSKSVARAARALVFDGKHVAISVMVDCNSVSNQLPPILPSVLALVAMIEFGTLGWIL